MCEKNVVFFFKPARCKGKCCLWISLDLCQLNTAGISPGRVGQGKLKNGGGGSCYLVLFRPIDSESSGFQRDYFFCLPNMPVPVIELVLPWMV